MPSVRNARSMSGFSEEINNLKAADHSSLWKLSFLITVRFDVSLGSMLSLSVLLIYTRIYHYEKSLAVCKEHSLMSQP